MNTFRLRTMLSAAVLLACAALSAGGCAATKAMNQPEKRDMKVLNAGVPRTRVIAELGKPEWSDERPDHTVDVFKFKQGYTKTTKATRAMVHAAADVATLGLWEVVGIPAETIADGTEVQVEVHYNAQQNVERVVVIKGEKAVNPPKLFARRSKSKTTEPAAAVAVADDGALPPSNLTSSVQPPSNLPASYNASEPLTR